MEKKDYEPLIRRTLRDFDFGKVHKVMGTLGWKWDLDGEDWYTSDGEHIRPTHFMYIPSLPDTNTEKK